jgi:hypothetical protein
MSFLDDIADVGSSALSFLGGSGIINSLARTALAGYAVSQLAKSTTPNNTTGTTATVDPGVRLQVDANPENSIPVVYGSAYLGGIITDATLANNGQTMYYCITLCERTGRGIGSSESDRSTFKFGNIYRDDNRIIFENDGITVKSEVDRNNNVCLKPAGKIKIWCYAGGSTSPVAPNGYSNGSLPAATSVFPGWSGSNAMTDLIFAIVRIDYDATNNIRGLGTFKFNVQNSLTLPGDCLYDYMTNTRYGAGIPPAGVYAS